MNLFSLFQKQQADSKNDSAETDGEVLEFLRGMTDILHKFV